LLIPALLFLAACGARNDLTREQAAAALAKAPLRGAQQVIQLRAEVGQFANAKAAADWARRYMLATDDAAQAMARDPSSSAGDTPRETVVRNLGPLRDANRRKLLGDVSFSETKPVSSDREPATSRLVANGALAKDLVQYCRRKTGASYEPGDASCVAVTAVRRFGAVTGITGDNRKKTVEFSATVEPTAIGRRLGLEKKSEKRTATFARYDDGWRIAGL